MYRKSLARQLVFVSAVGWAAVHIAEAAESHHRDWFAR